MKKIFTFLLSTLIGLSVFASDDASKVTVSFYGSNDYQVYIDGRSIHAKNNRVYLNNIRPGKHTIEVYDSKRNKKRKKDLVYAKNFVVRPQYDLNITVDRKGYVRFDEDRNYKNNSNDRDRNDRDRDYDHDRNRDWDRNRNYDNDRNYDKSWDKK